MDRRCQKLDLSLLDGQNWYCNFCGEDFLDKCGEHKKHAHEEGRLPDLVLSHALPYRQRSKF